VELKSGGKAIIPGDVKQSALIERIFTDDADEAMPPKKTGKHLTAVQRDILKRWIEQGANMNRIGPTFCPPIARKERRFAGADGG
jgi:hypothetical protein